MRIEPGVATFFGDSAWTVKVGIVAWSSNCSFGGHGSPLCRSAQDGR